MKPLYLFLYLCLYLLFPVGPLFVVQMQNRNHIIDFKFHRCPHSFHQFYCESLKICTYVEFCTYMHNAQLHNWLEEMLHKISQILSFVVGGEIALKIAIFRILCLCVGGCQWRGELRRFRGTVALSTYLPFWSVEIFAKCDAAARAGWGLPGHWNMPKTTLEHPWFRCTRVPKTILHIHGFVVLEFQKQSCTSMVSLY